MIGREAATSRRQFTRQRPSQLPGQLRSAGRSQLVGMETHRQTRFGGGRQNAPALRSVEHALLAEDVARAGDALPRNGRQLLPDDARHVRVRSVGSGAELRRNRVRTQERRHELDRAFSVQAIDQLQ
jgi:hypothetical protein